MQKSKLQFKIQKPSLYRRGERRERSSLRSFKFLAVVFSFSFSAFSFAISVSAAELFFEPRSQELGVGQEFQIDLMINPLGKEINVVAASIVFPEGLVEVKSIEDGGSILTLWVERPSLKNGLLSFAGVVPGGFAGMVGPWEGKRPGQILRLIAVTREQGVGEFKIEDAEVLLHDGKGTKAEFSIFNFQISIREDIEEVPLVRVPDTTPPEPFTPEIARDPNVFDGKWFLVFVTQDKNSGIDYYAVYETRRKIDARQIRAENWVEAESPYVLKDQELRSYIFVKAVDRAGNERIAEVLPRYPIKWYEIWWIWVIIILAIILSWLILKKCRKQRELPISPA